MNYEQEERHRITPLPAWTLASYRQSSPTPSSFRQSIPLSFRPSSSRPPRPTWWRGRPRASCPRWRSSRRWRSSLQTSLYSRAQLWVGSWASWAVPSPLPLPSLSLSPRLELVTTSGPGSGLSPPGREPSELPSLRVPTQLQRSDLLPSSLEPRSQTGRHSARPSPVRTLS